MEDLEDWGIVIQYFITSHCCETDGEIDSVNKHDYFPFYFFYIFSPYQN